MAITVEQFIERLSESGLMSAAEVSQFQQGLPPEQRPKDVQQFAQVLIQQGKLTRFQATAVYQGKTKGLVFGEYVVLDKLGEGGMGVVLKAQHRRMKRTVAIKVLSSAAMKQAGAVERFHREVEAAAKLSHSNIVTAYDASEHQGMHYLAMEYVEGRDLATIVKDRGPLPLREAAECILQAARGLQYAHGKGIVHRDIKPGNLLLDKDGTVKILDMGLARIAGADAAMGGPERLTNTGQVMGTCDYMAPEQAMDSHMVDARADIYALGCTLYRLLTGNPPYGGETLMQILMAHQQALIPSLSASRPDVPAELDELFQKMVAKQPEERQSSMAEVIAELEAVLGVSSGRSAARAPGEPSSAALAKSLAFLQEDAPLGTLTAHRIARGSEHTPAPRVERDTGGVFGVRRLVAAFHRGGAPQQAKATTSRRTPKRPLILVGLAWGLVLLLGIVLAITLRHGTPESNIRDLKSEISDLKSEIPPPAIVPFDAAKAKEHQEAWAKHLGVPVEMTNSIGMKLVLIPPGEFQMGSTKEEVEELMKLAQAANLQEPDINVFANHEVPQHHVRLTRASYMGTYMVTVAQFARFVKETGYKTDAERSGKGGRICEDGKEVEKPEITWHNPGYEQDQEYPVVQVTWNDAREFCNWLTRREGKTYRLPTEAEWEYACRAGTTTKYYCGNDEKQLGDYEWHRGNSDGKHPVGQKKPNPWGLYDMLGNVCAWCADWWADDYYRNSAADDPVGPSSGTDRVRRGHDRWAHPLQIRCAARQCGRPDWVHPVNGFRVVCTLEPPPAIAPFDAQKAKEHQEAWAKHLGVPVETTNSIGMKLVLIPPGEFMMGSPKELIEEELKIHADDKEPWYRNSLPSEGPQHRVRITRPFYFAVYEVTQQEYQRVTGKSPSRFSATGQSKDNVAGQDTRRFPVEQVSWDDAVEFCRGLSEIPEEKAAGRTYCLPSEAQWEYACRAGSQAKWNFGDEKARLGEYGWSDGNADCRTHRVGQLKANPFGLYDMHGNVWQWCADWYSDKYYAVSPLDDPYGVDSGFQRARRGGSWARPAWGCRSASRESDGPGVRDFAVGFRVALVLADKSGEGAPPAVSSESKIQNPKSEISDSKSGIPPRAVAPFDAAKAKEHQEGWAKHLGTPVELTNSIGMKLVLIPPGEFMMGSPKELIEEELKTASGFYRDVLPGEGPRHRVRITRPFYLGMYDVTQEEYRCVIGANPSQFSAEGQQKDWVAGQDTRRFPVENISWDEAVEFCRKLSNLPGEMAAERRYCLPSEAQWEYACRAGTATRWHFGDDAAQLAEYGWFGDNANGRPHRVGQLRANPWGLYDMCGNVFEWCVDRYEMSWYVRSSVDDPCNVDSGSWHVFRSGSWDYPAGFCRSAFRLSHEPAVHLHNLGLRVALVLADK
jgi:formylglycine-generating enzyme required for sulfatase activity/predicted Ser/Thr protein kinase